YHSIHFLRIIHLHGFISHIYRKQKNKEVTTISNRIALYGFSAILIITSAFSAYFQDVSLLLIPFGLLACYYLIHHPDYLFYLLLASVPWSMEYSFSKTLGTDLPDEPLMLLTTLFVIIWVIYHNKTVSLRKLHPLLWIILFELLWTIFTVITSTHVIVSIKYLLAKCWYLLAFAFAPVVLFRDEK